MKFLLNGDIIHVVKFLWICRHSLTVKLRLPKPPLRVRLPLPAPRRSKFRLFRFFICIKNQSPAALLLLFRKRSRSRRLFACKRTHNAFGSLPTFCGYKFLCLFSVTAHPGQVSLVPIFYKNRHFHLIPF